jgi:hypothetical protein
MAAIHAGKSVASTMGFTAVDGLPMGTRCGNLDPGVVLYLMDELKMDARAIEKLLYQQSGLLGVSGISSDMRTLLDSAEPKAQFAVELFVYRIGRELGSLAAALGGLDALVFTAGIGEHAVPIRERVCQAAAWLGVDLDPAANAAGGPRISMAGSRVAVWVLPTNEELMIARQTRTLVAARAVCWPWCVEISSGCSGRNWLFVPTRPASPWGLNRREFRWTSLKRERSNPMLKHVRKMAGPAVLATLLLAGSLALAADAKQPSGTVAIEETQFAIILGGSSGGGTLTFQGQQYPFKVSGLTAGVNVGISKMSAAGEVYDLTELAQFPGTYTKLDASIALGGGVGGLHLKNENGVIMRLEARTQGLQLNVGSASGIKVTME